MVLAAQKRPNRGRRLPGIISARLPHGTPTHLPVDNSVSPGGRREGVEGGSGWVKGAVY